MMIACIAVEKKEPSCALVTCQHNIHKLRRPDMTENINQNKSLCYQYKFSTGSNNNNT